MVSTKHVYFNIETPHKKKTIQTLTGVIINEIMISLIYFHQAATPDWLITASGVFTLLIIPA